MISIEIKTLIDENEQPSLRTMRENERLADIPGLEHHPRPVAKTPPLILKEDQAREFPYSK